MGKGHLQCNYDPSKKSYYSCFSNYIYIYYSGKANTRPSPTKGQCWFTSFLILQPTRIRQPGSAMIPSPPITISCTVHSCQIFAVPMAIIGWLEYHEKSLPLRLCTSSANSCRSSSEVLQVAFCASILSCSICPSAPDRARSSPIVSSIQWLLPSLHTMIRRVQIHFESAASSKTQKKVQCNPLLCSPPVRHCKQVAITDPLISLHVGFTSVWDDVYHHPQSWEGNGMVAWVYNTICQIILVNLLNHQLPRNLAIQVISIFP